MLLHNPIDPGEEIVKEFNEMRTQKGYTAKIEEMIKNIQPNPQPKKNQNFIYVQNKVPKTMLLKGEEAFREMIDILNSMDPLPKFTFTKELAVEVPEGSKEWSDKDNIANLVNNKKEELKDKYSSFTFHYDMGTSLPEVSAILQVVDDNIDFG